MKLSIKFLLLRLKLFLRGKLKPEFPFYTVKRSDLLTDDLSIFIFLYIARPVINTFSSSFNKELYFRSCSGTQSPPQFQRGLLM